ncbi:MAG: membrane protein insertion efficiency factor YidD [Bryobacteraceae bacterium]|nr:membrane protein insertion efficiency factor YidD [Bryobacteraceae bacterium]
MADAESALEHCHQSPPRGGQRLAAAATTGSGKAFRPVSAALLFCLRGYKLLISPLLPSACRFYPTCSCYMHDAIAAHGPGRGVYLGVRRLLKCHPWHPGGMDPVPPPQRTELHGR